MDAILDSINDTSCRMAHEAFYLGFTCDICEGICLPEAMSATETGAVIECRDEIRRCTRCRRLLSKSLYSIGKGHNPLIWQLW